MENIDIKDRKILYELDLNSRQSFSKIGKKVGLHRNNVIYRVNNLIQKGIIENFYTFIDANKLGYNGYRVYIWFQYTTPEIEQEIINYCVNNKYTWWVITGKRTHDLALLIWVKEITTIHVFWENLLLKYRYYIKDHTVAIYLQLSEYELTFLCSNKPKINRKKFEVTSGKKNIVTIDDLDYRILRLIANNARLPTIDISKKLKIDTKTVNTRINKLKTSGVIQGFRTNINLPKIGYMLCKVNINLLDYTKRSEIISYIKSDPNFKYLAKSLGFVDLELGFVVENINQFNQIVDGIIDRYSKYIIEIISWYGWKTHKMIYIPEE